MRILDFFNKKENKDKYIKWLKKNAGERMDANRKELFKPDRCDFHLDRYEFASKYIKDGNKVLDVASGTGFWKLLKIIYIRKVKWFLYMRFMLF